MKPCVATAELFETAFMVLAFPGWESQGFFGAWDFILMLFYS